MSEAGSEAPPSMLAIPQKSVVQEEILEGRLFLRAVDPYNFYWLPGSKLNRWVGTIEDIEIPLGIEFHAESFGLNVQY
jgi:hypothetical protein